VNTDFIKCISSQQLGTMAKYVIWLTNIGVSKPSLLKKEKKVDSFVSDL
jgi:hypothetical protein